jgi:hypothetical protein
VTGGAPETAGQDIAAPTAAFRAFVASEHTDPDEGGYPGYSRVGADDEVETGGDSTAVWGLVLGIVGILAMPFLGLGVIASVAGLFTSRVARRNAAGKGGRSGGGMARAGWILGWVGIALFVVVIAATLWIKVL